MRVLVCGGRDYDDQKRVSHFLDCLLERKGLKVVIQGGAKGADSLARQWASEHPEVQSITEKADWKGYQRAAGNIRNQKMLDKHKPDLVLAFPGGRGTKDMVHRATMHNIPVIQVRETIH